MPISQNHLVVATCVLTEIFSADMNLVTSTFYFVSLHSSFKPTSLQQQQATTLKFHALFLFKHSLSTEKTLK